MGERVVKEQKILLLFSIFHYYLIEERSIELSNIKDFQIKRKSIKRELFPKWETKKYKKEIRTKELNLCPYISVLL